MKMNPDLDLTYRQTQVMGYIADGLLDKEIADILHISVRTVNKHVYLLLKELGARNRANAVKIYYLKIPTTKHY
jgi:DNA-binding CsgD family transcriptional regulator